MVAYVLCMPVLSGVFGHADIVDLEGDNRPRAGAKSSWRVMICSYASTRTCSVGQLGRRWYVSQLESIHTRMWLTKHPVASSSTKLVIYS